MQIHFTLANFLQFNPKHVRQLSHHLKTPLPHLIGNYFNVNHFFDFHLNQFN